MTGIERCLAKDPAGRYLATGDLAHDLRMLRERLGEITASASVAATPVAQPLRTAAVLLSVLALTALAGWLALAQGGGGNLAAYRFTPLATDPGFQGMPEWSPDGKTIAYAAEVDGIVQVSTRSLTSSMRARITRTLFDCRDPFWAPDGSRIYYISLAGDKEGLWSISAAGGEPELVMENVDAAAISPDGRTLAFFREEVSQGGFHKALWLSSPPRAEPRRYTEPPFGTTLFAHAVLHFSPDGSTIGVWTELHRIDADGASPRAFWIIPLPTGRPRVVMESMWSQWTGIARFSWLPDSRRPTRTARS